MGLSLLDILADPDQLQRISPANQGIVIRQARYAALLGHLAERAIFDEMPAKVTDQLLSARIYSDFYDVQIKWETRCVEEILGGMKGPVILLKGAAYKALDLGLARGRLASDVDLLLPREQLVEAEELLKDAGWEPMKEDAYDEHYYREWMHELPPLQHEDRGTIIDLHHNILPPTARFKPDADKLIEASLPMPDSPLYTLCPEDNLLHRCAHLFIDGDMHNSLRELVDINEMLKHYAIEDGFLQRCRARAEILGLELPLHYALHFAGILLDCRMDSNFADLPKQNGLDRLTCAAMDMQLRPACLDHKSIGMRLSSWYLFMRSHWLRMPPLMLLQHLLTQVWRRRGFKVG